MITFRQILRNSVWLVVPVVPLFLAGCPMPLPDNPPGPVPPAVPEPVATPVPAPTATPAPTAKPTESPKPAPKIVVNQLITPKKMSIYNFKLKTLEGSDLDLKTLKGKVVLIVNTASKCGYTKQYAGLQALSEKYKGKGLAVVGFPANEFGGQEPGSDAEIATFCQKNYGVTFQMMSKVVVKGADKSPIFKFLTEDANPALKREIEWNFEKFLLSRDGQLVARYKSAITPDSPELNGAIEAELAKK